MRWFGPLSNGKRCTRKVIMAICRGGIRAQLVERKQDRKISTLKAAIAAPSAEVG
jgi:hypothetical protein